MCWTNSSAYTSVPVRFGRRSNVWNQPFPNRFCFWDVDFCSPSVLLLLLWIWVVYISSSTGRVGYRCLKPRRKVLISDIRLLWPHPTRNRTLSDVVNISCSTGRVINVGSVHGRYSSAAYGSYTKHGIEHFSDVVYISCSTGRVINVGSVHGRYSSPVYGCYGLTKHGIEHFSDVLRMEMREFGVEVSVIEPGSFGAATGIMSGKAVRYFF